MFPALSCSESATYQQISFLQRFIVLNSYAKWLYGYSPVVSFVSALVAHAVAIKIAKLLVVQYSSGT